jgi:hypothetical protein
MVISNWMRMRNRNMKKFNAAKIVLMLNGYIVTWYIVTIWYIVTC